jgi:spermidine synthase
MEMRSDPLHGKRVVLLFSATLFLSAALSFGVQPMIGKMVLPLLGGVPAVWNTCMVFFQSTLLLGYAYAHWSTRWIGSRYHILTHLGLMLLPALVLPISISQRMLGSLPTDTNPIPWLLGFLALTAGLPLLVVSTTAPLLQKWFASTAHPDAGNPYFLYAASNAGSLLGLLGYPILIEPHLRLGQQSHFWAVGYGILVVLVLCCAVIMWRRKTPTSDSETGATDEIERALPVAWRRRLRWMLLAFVPSSLMLGVTTYITTDVAPIPLLWVLPLGLYLLTFIFVFARRPFLAPSWLGRVLCLLTVMLIICMIAEVTQPAWLIVTLHLSLFFAAAMTCHSELAKDRPPAEHLTDFYLCLSIGGVLGGIMNALLAPVIFHRVWEYPLVMILACAVRPMNPDSTAISKQLWQKLLWPLGIGLLMAGLILSLRSSSATPPPLTTIAIFGVPALLAYRLVERPSQFALSLTAILAASSLYASSQGQILHIERDFFGVLRVTLDPQGKFHQIVQGNTVHGRQSVDPLLAKEPLSYYHHTGPVGQVFEVFNAAPAAPRVAIVGLGAGTLACYAQAGQDWTFYEIDPAVQRIADDPQYFTFLKYSRAGKLNVILGDARLRLREAPERQYGLLILDAFSSDAIPVHLLTREALHLYLEKLADGGLIALHISNRRLDLKPVIANLANDAHLVCFNRDDFAISASESNQGKQASQWVVLARTKEDLHALESDKRWQSLYAQPSFGLWTDDFSDIISLLKWR